MPFQLPRPFWRPRKSRARQLADDAVDTLRDGAEQVAEAVRAAGGRVSLPRPWLAAPAEPEASQPRRWRGVVIRVPRGTRVRVAPKGLPHSAGDDPESWVHV
ncbi:MAG: hypothetical protein M3409_06405 [Gemmatimonadota bacterium]|jgi:hypothetical protein|nr:hypothetical protein [Gemmatimonadota bacterium]